MTIISPTLFYCCHKCGSRNTRVQRTPSKRWIGKLGFILGDLLTFFSYPSFFINRVRYIVCDDCGHVEEIQLSYFT